MHDLRFATDTADSRPLHLVPKGDLAAWLDGLAPHARKWAEADGFSAGAGQSVALPAQDGGIEAAAIGLGDDDDRRRRRFLIAGARKALPAGSYRLDTTLTDRDTEAEALGWLLEGYRFHRYKDGAPPKADLIAPTGIDAARLEHIAAGEALTRDLINTPSSDMGPAELEAAVSELAKAFGASITVTRADDLHAANLPMIHTVGRASARSPRLIDLTWGAEGPSVTLVGKGVCFDTGGLNLKPGASMGLMKKDMGGAATVLGLARMIMASALPLRLRVLIPAVENAVGGDAFRPGDILTSRKGLTVEINNTDAEGRLVLADALALADETPPDLMISMATLTGAARVALGPDLAPFFTDDEGLAGVLSASGQAVRDPVWRLPFWDPYETMIEPGIADLDNAPKGGFAGAITAALFLRRFVTATPRYAHFDIYGWQPTAAPGRPKGGVGQGGRAIFDALPELLGL